MEREEIRIIDKAMNDYVIRSDADKRAIFKNLPVFIKFAECIVRSFKDFFEQEKKPFEFDDISRMNVQDKIKLISDFYEKNGISCDVNKYINDGTIDFNFYDILNNNAESEKEKLHHMSDGCMYNIHQKKLIDVCSTGLVTDASVLVHELSHLRDKEGEERNQVSEMLTEALAITEENIFLDYLSGLGYSNEAKIFTRDYYRYAYELSKSVLPEYRIINLYRCLGTVSEEAYELLYESKENYSEDIKVIDSAKKVRKLGIFFDSRYVIGFCLASYMFSEYKKDPSFVKKIDELHKLINKSKVTDCFKYIGLSNLDEEDLKRIEESLLEVKDDLEWYFKENNKKR